MTASAPRMVTGAAEWVAAMAAAMTMRWSLAPSTVPPVKDMIPWTVRLSGLSSALPPKAFSKAAVVERRSLSLMRSRAALINLVVPCRMAAITARGGSRSGQPDTSMSTSPGFASFQ